jgi:NADH-quinone oxidoreductase subunit N
MLAYSSIAHAGYMLMGVVAGTSRGVAAMLIYILIYAFMQLGAFTVVVLLSPFAAFAMLLFMLSLGGIPPTAGFMGKFWLFGAAIDSGYVWLAVIGVLNSAISLYYYIRLVVFMYLRKETLGTEPVAGPSLTFALVVAVAATIVLGIYPRALFEVAEASARTLGVVGSLTALR